MWIEFKKERMAHHPEANWYETPLGEYLARHEQDFFDKSVADIFGFNAVQFGLTQYRLLRNCRIPYCFYANSTGPVEARISFDALPFADQSIDLLLLPHVLEFADHPHQILREAARVLMPEGQIIISGFNPLSLWGARKSFGAKNNYPWHGNFLHLARIKDWLELLEFEIVSGKMCCYVPPIQREKWLRRFEFLEAMGDRWWALAGGVYFLQAKKKVVGMRLLTPNWKTAPAAKAGLAPVAQKRFNVQQVNIQSQDREHANSSS